MSSFELRNESLGGEMEATLEQLLAHRSAVVLGEPGSGKSTVARVAVERTTARGWVPLFGSLHSYTGDIAQLLANDAPVELVAGEAVDGVRPIRILILDGLDEIRQEQLHRFIEDLSELLHQDEHLRVLLTARQAFYAANLSLFGNQPQAFYLLDFNENNIRQCVEHSGDDYTPSWKRSIGSSLNKKSQIHLRCGYFSESFAKVTLSDSYAMRLSVKLLSP